MRLSDSDITLTGQRPFEWFGSSAAVTRFPKNTFENDVLLLVGASASWKTTSQSVKHIKDNFTDSIVPLIHNQDETGHNLDDWLKDEMKETSDEISSGTGRVYGFHLKPSKNVEPRILFSIRGSVGRSKLGHLVKTFQDWKGCGDMCSLITISAPSLSDGRKLPSAGIVVVLDTAKLVEASISHNASTTPEYELFRDIPGLLHTIRGEIAFGRMGHEVWVGDINNDGSVELLVSQPFAKNEKGVINLYSNIQHPLKLTKLWKVSGFLDVSRLGESFTVLARNSSCGFGESSNVLLASAPRVSPLIDWEKVDMGGAALFFDIPLKQ